MSEIMISRQKRNKDKGVYRILFAIAVTCLLLFFWLDIAQSVTLSTVKTFFAYIFLMALSIILGWRLWKEQEPPSETAPPPAPDA